MTDPGSDEAPPVVVRRRRGRRISSGRRWLIVLLSAVIVVAVDQVTKWRALESLTAGDPVDLFWTFRLNLMFNTGMAFSRGRDAGPIIALVASLIVIVLLLFARKVRSRLQLVLIGVVVGGAIGNIVDRGFRADDGFLTGGVVDFVDPQFWPVFNVADACVVVGGICLALTTFAGDDDDRRDDDRRVDDRRGDDRVEEIAEDRGADQT